MWLGGDVVAVTSSFLRGDNGNQQAPLSGYTLLNLQARYAPFKFLEFWAGIFLPMVTPRLPRYAALCGPHRKVVGSDDQDAVWRWLEFHARLYRCTAGEVNSTKEIRDKDHRAGPGGGDAGEVMSEKPAPYGSDRPSSEPPDLATENRRLLVQVRRLEEDLANLQDRYTYALQQDSTSPVLLRDLGTGNVIQAR